MERKVINNAFYHELNHKWYESYDHPIALLRAENQTRAPWIIQIIAHHFPHLACKILDIGCGGGFLSNQLAQAGHDVSGIDLSEASLKIAKEKDRTGRVSYQLGDATHLDFNKEQFEVVCAMDLLEHVEEPIRVIEEAARTLKSGGLFFFHTFNRNWFSWLFAIKGIDWLVPNAPRNMHLYRLFIKPQELKSHLQRNHLEIATLSGLMPTLDRAFFKLIFQKKISQQFSFKIVPSTKCGYMGYAIKKRKINN